MNNINSIFDLKRLAQENLPEEVFAYMSKGTEDDVTLQRNSRIFDRYQILPRRLVDVRSIDTSINIFGKKLESPIFLSPVGFQAVFYEDGEIATAKAAEARGHLMMVSTVSNFSYAEVAAEMTRKPWFQLYPTTNRAVTLQLMQRAEQAGSPVLVLTIDVPVLGNRLVHVRQMGHLSKAKKRFGNLELLGEDVAIHDPSMTWEMIAWLKERTKMKIVLKGIQRADDAALALQYGADGIIISNHGGRQLESNLSTLECLEDIAKVIHGKIPLLIDGGIRRGTDILKALALGADAVCVGRAFCYGLAAAGQEGVEKALEIFQTELVRNMKMTGARNLQELDASFVRKCSCPTLLNN